MSDQSVIGVYHTISEAEEAVQAHNNLQGTGAAELTHHVEEYSSVGSRQ